MRTLIFTQPADLAQQVIAEFESRFNYLKTSRSMCLSRLFGNPKIAQWKNEAAKNIALELAAIKEPENLEIQITALFQLAHEYLQESRMRREKYPHKEGDGQFPFKSSNFENLLYQAALESYLLLPEDYAKSTGVTDLMACIGVLNAEKDSQMAYKDNHDPLFNHFPFCTKSEHKESYMKYVVKQQDMGQGGACKALQHQ